MFSFWFSTGRDPVCCRKIKEKGGIFRSAFVFRFAGESYSPAAVAAVSAVVSVTTAAVVSTAAAAESTATAVVSTGAVASDDVFPPQETRNPVATIARANNTFFIFMGLFKMHINSSYFRTSKQ